MREGLTMSDTSSNPVVLITGGARRIGACIARRLHSLGYNIALHHRNSAQEATALAEDLNPIRANSVVTIYADLNQLGDIKSLVDAAVAHWGRLDAVINNASSFYPTPLGSVTQEQWDDLLNSNLKAPFFIAQAAAKALQISHGCILTLPISILIARSRITRFIVPRKQAMSCSPNLWHASLRLRCESMALRREQSYGRSKTTNNSRISSRTYSIGSPLLAKATPKILPKRWSFCSRRRLISPGKSLL